ncbi:MAG: hypothetical protein VW907_01875 [Opitutae bacterium]
MNQADFLDSIGSDPRPDSSIKVELQALWWAKKGDWDKAHDLAQSAGSAQGDWIHAHLHRIEGDLGNASYWYSRAGKPVCKEDLSKEWQNIVAQIVDR